MELTAGTVAVVTGGASGIGRASALAPAEQGSDVLVADLDLARAQDVSREIEQLGRRSRATRVDVGERQEVERLVDESIDWQGHCDVFVSNAGVGVTGPPHQIPLEDWEWVMNINLWSNIWAVRRILPHMLERGSGHLVHTASSAGVVGFPSLAPYSVTKFGVVGLCESLAAYLHGTGVGVSVVCPLGVRTNIHERTRLTLEKGAEPIPDDQAQQMMKAVLHNMGIPPEKVARDIVDAIGRNRLYVFPSPELQDLVDAKWRDPDEWIAQLAAGVDHAQSSAAAGDAG